MLVGATDIAVATLKIMESATKTDATTLGGSPTQVFDVTTKPGAGDDDKVWVLGVNLRADRKQFLQLQATAGDGTTGTFLAATAVLRKSGVRGSTAAERGVQDAQYG